MSLFREIHKRSRLVIPQVLGASLVAYFAYHTIEGERGFWSWMHLKQNLAVKTVEMQKVSEDLSRLESRVALLRPDNLDPDLLEERAREVLNFGRENDYVILQNPGSR
ncbi:septum formation initiator family protein [Kiloniella laminariae]|uniref:Septum formation initiator family protein n=1 Tax=Kiloniella laminariae TaxID=454162 RepID=A0ABT4LLW6_9PROT|nr:septum formation initiator family protein [Kiloniella laminariae]MCZ4282059.1 septum formation initiator family protein [Kiloniella laminariae]